jgi:hypothetical protein
MNYTVFNVYDFFPKNYTDMSGLTQCKCRSLEFEIEFGLFMALFLLRLWEGWFLLLSVKIQSR